VCTPFNRGFKEEKKNSRPLFEDRAAKEHVYVCTVEEIANCALLIFSRTVSSSSFFTRRESEKQIRVFLLCVCV
jgi:hypothetical protein